jgi:plastocyanin
VQGIVGLVVVLSIISAVLTVTGTGGVSAAEKEGAQTLTAKKTKFDKDSLTASASGTTKIVLDNNDPFLHTFTVYDLDIDVKMNPGAEKLIEIKSPNAGSYEFHFRISGHEDMKGTLTVQ